MRLLLLPPPPFPHSFSRLTLANRVIERTFFSNLSAHVFTLPSSTELMHFAPESCHETSVQKEIPSHVYVLRGDGAMDGCGDTMCIKEGFAYRFLLDLSCPSPFALCHGPVSPTKLQKCNLLRAGSGVNGPQPKNSSFLSFAPLCHAYKNAIKAHTGTEGKIWDQVDFKEGEPGEEGEGKDHRGTCA